MSRLSPPARLRSLFSSLRMIPRAALLASSLLVLALPGRLQAQTNPPIINSSTSALGTVGQPFIYRATVSSGSPTNYSAVLPIPGFVTNQTNASGEFIGLPQTNGVFTSTVTAVSPTGNSTNNVVIQINPPPAPTFLSPVTVFGMQSTNQAGFFYPLLASPSPSNVPTRFSSTTNLPNGLGFSTNTVTNSTYTNVTNATFAIIATSAISTNGSFVIPIVASNAGGAVTNDVTFIINPTNRPVFTANNINVGATVAQPFSYDVTALNLPTGFRITNITFSTVPGVTNTNAVNITNGFLTNGLSFSNVTNGNIVVGRVSGVPGGASVLGLGLDASNSFGPTTNTSATLTITTTFSQPVVVMSQPVGEVTYVNGSSFYLNAQAFDDPDDTLLPSTYQFQAGGLQVPGRVGIYGSSFGLEYYPDAAAAITASAQNAFGITRVSPSLPMFAGQAQNPLPEVTMLPLNFGQKLVAGGKVILSARATIASTVRTIDRVEFYVNKVYVGSTPSPEPGTGGVYEFEWTTPSLPASYQVTARAVSLNFETGAVPPAGLLANTRYWASVIARRPTIVNTVQGIAPSVAITSPANNGTLTIGVPNRIQAAAFLPGGAIESVEFFANGKRIAPTSVSPNPDTTVPFEVEFTPNSFGAYEIYAIVTGSNGLQAVSPIVIANVNAGSVPTAFLTTPASARATAVLGAPATNTNGLVTFSVTNSIVNFVGSGYTNTPDVRVVGGGGSGALYFSQIATNGTNAGTVTNLVRTNAGSGYLTAPAVVIDPPTVRVGTNSTVLLQAAANDTDGTIAQVQFLQNGVVVGAAATSPYDLLLPVTSPGRYELVARVTDNSGNVTDSPYIVLNAITGTPPTVSITTPANGLTVPQAPLAIGWAANSSVGSVQSVQLLINGAPFGAAQTQGSGFTVFNPASQGRYVIVARATDSFGNVTDSLPVTVTIDNSVTNPNPAVVMDQRTTSDSGYVFGSQIYFNATATPQGSNTITNVSFVLGNGNQLTATNSGIPAGGQPIYAAGANITSGFPTGILARAIDSATNIGFSDVTDLYYGRPFSPLPTVDMLNLPPSSQAVAGGTIQLRARASFPTSQFNQGQTNTSRVEFYANGAFLGIGTANTNASTANLFTHTFDWAMPTNTNSFRLTARAVQLNYNVPAPGDGNAVTPYYGATISPQIVTTNTFTNTPPTVTITNPSTNGLQIGVGTTKQVLASVTTATNASVREVQWYIDGLFVTNSASFPYALNFAPTNSGLYNIAAVVVDSFGAIGNSGVREIKAFVGNAPTVSITTPKNNLTNPLTTLSVGWTSDDTDGFVNQVDILVNGVVVSTSAVGSGVFPYTPPSQGVYDFVARATDNFGNITDSTPVRVTIDNSSSPALPLVSLLPDTFSDQLYVAGSQLYFNATATARGSTTIPNNGVSFYLFGPEDEESASRTAMTLGTNFIYASRLYTFNDPVTDVLAQAEDSARNIGSSSVYPLDATRAPLAPFPVVSVATNLPPGSTPVAGGVVQLQAKASFPAPAGVAFATNSAGTSNNRVEFYADGAYLGTGTPNTNSSTANSFTHFFNWTTPPTSNSFQVTARAVGLNFALSGGNAGATNTRFYYGSKVSPGILTVNTLSNSAPGVSITTPSTNNSTVGVGTTNQVIATVTNLATNASVREVQFYLDGLFATNVTSSPYIYNFAPTNTGLYSLAAVVVDNFGLQGSSAVRTINVGRGTAPSAVTLQVNGQSGSSTATTVFPALSAASSGANIVFSYLASSAHVSSYSIFQNTNLTTESWTPAPFVSTLSTDQTGVPLGYGRYQFTVPATSGPNFYRVSYPASIGGALTAQVNQAVTLTADVAAAGNLVSRVDFFVNGFFVSTTSTAPYRYQLPLTSAGSYNIVARSVDQLGNVTESDPVVLNVSSGTAPTVSITTPKTGLVTPQTTLNVGWSAHDTDGSVTSVQLLVNGVVANTSAIGSGLFAYVPPSQGQYVFVARATDNLGNLTDSTPVTVTVDNNAANTQPLVTLDQRTMLDEGYVVGSQMYFNATAVPRGTNTIASNAVSFLYGSELSSLSALKTAVSVAGQSVYAASFQVLGALSPLPVTALALDSQGNTGLSSVKSLLIREPGAPFPTVDIFPLDNSAQAVAGGIIQLRAKANFPLNQFNQGATNDPRVEFYADGAFLGIATVNSNSSTSSAYTHTFDWRLPTNASSFKVTARAVQLNFNAPGSASNAIIPYYASSFSPQITTVNSLTNQAPSVSITQPSTNNAQVGVGITNQIIATVTNLATNASVKEVQFYVDGLFATNDTTFPYVYNFAPTNTGLYSLAALVVDNFGLQGSSSVRTLSAISGVPPTVSLTSDRAFAVVGQTNRLVATPSVLQPGTSIAQVEFLVNGAVSQTLTAANEGSSYVYNWPVTAPGDYQLQARATDNLGNVVVSSVLNLPTRTAPSVVLTAPTTATTGQTITMSATASPAGSISSVEFLVNGAVIATDTSAPYVANYTTPQLSAPATYQLQARATSTDGVPGVSNVVDLLISPPDPNLPFVSIVLPLAGSSQTVETPVSIQAVASAGANATLLSFSINILGPNNTTVLSTNLTPTGLSNSSFVTSYKPTNAGLFTINASVLNNRSQTGSNSSSFVAQEAPPVDPGSTQAFVIDMYEKILGIKPSDLEIQLGVDYIEEQGFSRAEFVVNKLLLGSVYANVQSRVADFFFTLGVTPSRGQFASCVAQVKADTSLMTGFNDYWPPASQWSPQQPPFGATFGQVNAAQTVYGELISPPLDYNTWLFNRLAEGVDGSLSNLQAGLNSGAYANRTQGAALAFLTANFQNFNSRSPSQAAAQLGYQYQLRATAVRFLLGGSWLATSAPGASTPPLSRLARLEVSTYDSLLSWVERILADTSVVLVAPGSASLTAAADAKGGAVTNVPVTAAGNGYSQASVPAVVVAAPLATTVTANAAINGSGVVTNITPINLQTNGYYRTLPIVTVGPPTALQTNRTTATATAQTNSSGRVTNIVVNSGGLGYASAPWVKIAPPDSAQAVVDAYISSSNTVEFAEVLPDGGVGYITNSPQVIIDGPNTITQRTNTAVSLSAGALTNAPLLRVTSYQLLLNNKPVATNNATSINAQVGSFNFTTPTNKSTNTLSVRSLNAQGMIISQSPWTTLILTD